MATTKERKSFLIAPENEMKFYFLAVRCFEAITGRLLLDGKKVELFVSPNFKGFLNTLKYLELGPNTTYSHSLYISAIETVRNYFYDGYRVVFRIDGACYSLIEDSSTGNLMLVP